MNHSLYVSNKRISIHTKSLFRVCLFTAFSTLAFYVYAGETTPAASPPAELLKAAEEIAGREVITHAKILSDPAYRGREASEPGARKAALYVAEQFRRAGLRPGGSAGGYFQMFKIKPGYRISSNLEVSVAGSPAGDFRRGEHYMPVHIPKGKVDITSQCVLAGYGISSDVLKFDEYKGLDAKGKVAIVFSGTPWSADTGLWIARGLADKKYGTIAYKASNAAAHGAVGLFVVDNPAGWRKRVGLLEELRIPDTNEAPLSPIPVIHVSRTLLSKITDMSIEELRLLAVSISREMTPESLPLRGRLMKFNATIEGRARVGRNIIGILPGRDETLMKEAVVIGAHYDHLGEGAEEEIFFGANDNAAGVGALIEVARAFSRLSRPPKRTIVFIAFDAEEIGRRGSKHYIANSAVPTAKTTLMINFDMIGCNEPDSIYAVGTRSSDELHRIHQSLNRHTGLKLVHPESFRLGRSDHSPFYYAKVPIIYFFGGLDKNYNTPRDTWEKLIPGKVEKVSRLAFLTSATIADRAAGLIFKSSDGSDF